MKEWDKINKNKEHWETKEPSKLVKIFLKYIKKQDKILEIGCGSGRDLIFLTKKGYDIEGIDISKEALKKIKEKIKIKQGNAENLDFLDNSFDVIYSIFTLQFTDLEKSAKEIKRVLKKGGIAFLTYIIKTEYVETKKIHEINKEKILKNFKDLETIKEHIYTRLDKGKEPHYHTIFLLILK